jgi:hypothetical protein
MGRHRKAPRTLSNCPDPFEGPQFALARKVFTMSFTLFIDTPCPKCLKPLMAAINALLLCQHRSAATSFGFSQSCNLFRLGRTPDPAKRDEKSPTCYSARRTTSLKAKCGGARFDPLVHYARSGDDNSV